MTLNHLASCSIFIGVENDPRILLSFLLPPEAKIILLSIPGITTQSSFSHIFQQYPHKIVRINNSSNDFKSSIYVLNEIDCFKRFSSTPECLSAYQNIRFKVNSQQIFNEIENQ